jgi:hypothetical protein
MKNFGKLFITVGAAALMSVSVYAGENVESRIFVNGEEIYDASAITSEGYTMIPLRFIAEKLGCTVSWDSDTKTATIKDGATVVKFTEGVKTMIVDDRIKDIPVAPVIEDDYAYVPLRALSDGLDIDVTWNEMTKTVSVYSAAAARADYNNDYSEAPEAALKTVYMKSDEDIVIPINCDPNLPIEVEMDEDKENVCEVTKGYYEGQKALFIHSKERGTAGITLYYKGFSSTGYHRTYINVRVVERKEKALTTFDDMLKDKELYYKDIINEIEENQRSIENDNGLYVFDRTNDEYEKLFVGDEGMLIIPVDYSDDASGVFDIAYDHSKPIECKWGEYGGKQAIMITASDYTYVPVRISFKEDNSGKVSFTVTDKDMSVKETPVVYAYGNNDTDTTFWDTSIRSIAEGSQELKIKNDLVKDRIVYIR